MEKLFLVLSSGSGDRSSLVSDEGLMSVSRHRKDPCPHVQLSLSKAMVIQLLAPSQQLNPVQSSLPDHFLKSAASDTTIGLILHL